MRFGNILISLLLFCVGCKSDMHENVSVRFNSFYHYYITEEYKNSRSVGSDTIKAYFTKRFLASRQFDADKYDWDPIIQSQDYNEKMLETLKVDFKTQRGDALYFDLNFIEEFKNRKCSRILVVRLENDLWKIDTVINNDDGQFILLE